MAARDTTRWQDQCTSGISHRSLLRNVKRALAHGRPQRTRIALKLRMARVLVSEAIAKTLMAHSPFVRHMDADQRIYVNKGIAPVRQSSSPGTAPGDQFQQLRD